MPDILLATHSPVFSKLLGETLSKAGFDVSYCGSVESVVEEYNNAHHWQPYKIVIIDACLPPKDDSIVIDDNAGYGLIETLRPGPINNNGIQKKLSLLNILNNARRYVTAPFKPTSQFILLGYSWNYKPSSSKDVSFVKKGCTLKRDLVIEIRRSFGRFWKKQKYFAWYGFIPLLISGALLTFEDIRRGPDFSGFTIGLSAIAIGAFLYMAAIRAQYPKTTITANRNTNE
jgi:CheY-like chemotaxis protein